MIWTKTDEAAASSASIVATAMGGNGGCRVGEVRAGTTSPMPDHKATVTVRDPSTPFLSEFSEI